MTTALTALAASGKSSPDGLAYDYKTAIDELQAAFVGGSVNVAADVLAIPITHRIVRKTTGADGEALTLADGAPGQMLTITLVTDGGGDGTLSPTTCTGFVSIVFADAGDTATLQFVDDTVGWVIAGTAGVAAPPAIALT